MKRYPGTDVRFGGITDNLSEAAPLPDTEPLVVEIARELYDRFVMGGWEPQDAYPQIREWLASRDQRVQDYDVRPFDKLPEDHAKHVEQWLTANQQKSADVRWSLYPLGMVGRWIERAETAEAALHRESKEKL